MRTVEFGNPGESRTNLINFILHGNKRATAGLLSEYEAEGEPIEHVGERLAVLDNDNQHIATLEITRVEVLRFIDVPDEFALAEAEGDLSAADFRKSHLDFWTAAGETIADETKVVTLYFDLVEVLSSAK
jgi:uncharacterized protein YhfF